MYLLRWVAIRRRPFFPWLYFRNFFLLSFSLYQSQVLLGKGMRKTGRGTHPLGVATSFVRCDSSLLFHTICILAMSALGVGRTELAGIYASAVFKSTATKPITVVSHSSTYCSAWLKLSYCSNRQSLLLLQDIDNRAKWTRQTKRLFYLGRWRKKL